MPLEVSGKRGMAELPPVSHTQKAGLSKQGIACRPKQIGPCKQAPFQQALASRPQRRQSSIAALDRLIKYGLPRRQPHESGVWGYF